MTITAKDVQGTGITFIKPRDVWAEKGFGVSNQTVVRIAPTPTPAPKADKPVKK